jgi:arginine decarboxylase
LNNYGLDIWGNDNFIIDDGILKLNHKSRLSLIDIVNDIQNRGEYGPLILRFPHIVQEQIHKLYKNFNESIKEYNYNSSFYALFPLKVNQFPSNIIPMMKNSSHLNYGLEAGSKAELLLAMGYNNQNSPITVNGFKDEEMIILGFIASYQGYKRIK